MSVVSTEQILNYVNQARTNPKKFAQYIKTEMEQFHKDNRTLPLVPGCNYSTNEGKGAWIQCKNFLQSFNPVEPYKLSKSLSLAAQDHAADMAKHNFQGHTGSDGSSPSDRIDRRCNKVVEYGCIITSGENIGGDFKYEGRNFALNTVKSLLIDDGVNSRGHRKNLISTQFKYIGIGSRVVGDRIRVVMVFHSHDPTIKSDKPPAQTGTELKFEKKPEKMDFDSFGKFESNFGQMGRMNDFDEMDHMGQFGQMGRFGQMGQQFQIGKMQSSESGKKVVGKKTSSSSSTVNGKTVTKTIQIITYSDGSTQTRQNTKTSG